jgi:hypothetical protein
LWTTGPGPGIRVLLGRIADGGFFETTHKRPAPITHEALQRIAALYEIQAEIAA